MEKSIKCIKKHIDFFDSLLYKSMIQECTR